MRWRRPKYVVEVSGQDPDRLRDEIASLVSALDERDRARDTAVALENENLILISALRELRVCAIERALVADDYLRIIDRALAEVET